MAALCLAGILSALFVRDRPVRVLALVAGLAGVSYLVLPTGASGIEQDTTLFEVNLRYAKPALALAIPLIPILVRVRVPKMTPAPTRLIPQAWTARAPGATLVMTRLPTSSCTS